MLQIRFKKIHPGHSGEITLDDASGNLLRKQGLRLLRTDRRLEGHDDVTRHDPWKFPCAGKEHGDTKSMA